MRTEYEKPTAEFISFEIDGEIMNGYDDYDDPIAGGSLVSGDEEPI